MPAPTHVEHKTVPGRRLGRRPADPARPVLLLGSFLTGKLPDHPPAVDYFERITEWNLGANDRYGTCGPTSLANLLLLVTTWLGDAPVRVTDEAIFDLYRRSGNPNFDPATGEDDNGVDMTVMLSAAVKGGIGGLKPLAFAKVNGDDPEEIWAAGALFGGVLWGADLTVAQEQDNGLWDYTPGARPWGGHAVLACGRYSDQPGTTADRTGLVSWAEVLDSTDAFIQRQVPERYVVLLEEHLGSKAFREGVDLPALAQAYTALTGRPFPVDPTPQPPVTPPAPDPGPVPPAVDDADRALARAVKQWTVAPHIGSNAAAARATKLWMIRKGLS